MKSMFFLKRVLRLCLIALALHMFTASTSSATVIPSAEFSYTETALTGGWWRYDLTVFNTTAGTAGDDVSGFDLYDFTITPRAGASFVGIALPAGWSSYSTPEWNGATVFNYENLAPDAVADFGSEILPGGSLAGFAFSLDYRETLLAFTSTMANPEGGDPYSLSVSASPEAAPVPEPSTFLLLGGGLLLLIRARKRHNS